MWIFNFFLFRLSIFKSYYIIPATTTYIIALFFIYWIPFSKLGNVSYYVINNDPNSLTNEDLQYTGITPLKAYIPTTEKHYHSVLIW